jgi:ABC-2 type transport system permease protein
MMFLSITHAAHGKWKEITVRLAEQDLQHVALVKLDASRQTYRLTALSQFFEKTFVIAEVEARKLRHDPTELVMRAIQPVLWLLVFGEVLTRTHVIPSGSLSYLDFMAPGILAQSVLFVAIFYGLAVIWERDLGIVHKFLASPVPRTALVLGKAISASLRAVSQMLIIYALAWLLGVRLNWNPLALSGVFGVVILSAALFSTLSLIIACVVKTRERFMGIGQVLTMPLFFASNAIYPASIMPFWLQAIVHVNPLTYEVDALRAMMLSGGTSDFGLASDFSILLATLAIMVVIGGKLYPRVAT